MVARRVNVVPHTHWDREWYSPFQKFRMRLVDMLDAFLPMLDADPSYSHFLLDGQMAVVDDYLEVRPEAAPVTAAPRREGRLAMGPWYTLPDEFLVSGETVIRNLQAGIARATEFGGAMDVGYLPDMFGHISQMPQIFRLFGFEHAVVWRGVPNAVDRTAFLWSSPDGSTVRAEYLWRGLRQRRAHHEGPEGADRPAHRVRTAHACGDGRAQPDLAGADALDERHATICHRQPWLGQVVAEVNAAQSDFELVITTLAKHLKSGPTKDLPKWTGELRSGGRANLLMGVTSNRTDVRIAAARAERALERLAEPFSALFLPAEKWPDASAAHRVEGDAAQRGARLDLRVLARRGRRRGDGALPRGAPDRRRPGVSKPSVRSPRSARRPARLSSTRRRATRGGLVELEVPGEGPAPGAQVLSERPSVRSEITFSADKLGKALETLRSQRIDDETYINAIDIDESDERARDHPARREPYLREWLELDAIKADIAATRERAIRNARSRCASRSARRAASCAASTTCPVSAGSAGRASRRREPAAGRRRRRHADATAC